MELRGNTIHRGEKNHQRTKFHSSKKLWFSFTIVFLIERKRRQLRRGIVLRNCFSKEQFTQVSEFSFCLECFRNYRLMSFRV